MNVTPGTVIECPECARQAAVLYSTWRPRRRHAESHDGTGKSRPYGPAVICPACKHWMHVPGAAPRLDRRAVVALVLGPFSALFGIFIGFWAVLLGFFALWRIFRNPNVFRGWPWAVAAIAVSAALSTLWFFYVPEMLGLAET